MVRTCMCLHGVPQVRRHFIEAMPNVTRKSLFNVQGRPLHGMQEHAAYRFYLHLDGQVCVGGGGADGYMSGHGKQNPLPVKHHALAAARSWVLKQTCACADWSSPVAVCC